MSYGKHDIIRIRRGTASEWSNSLPQPGGEVLKLGEPGYEKDTGKLKIGDGVTSWNSLAYFNDGTPIDPEQLQDLLGGGLLTAGSGISIIYNDNADTLTISTSGVAFLDSPNFTGTPTVPTAASGTNTTQIASTTFVRNEISNLLDSAPTTLDTLNELAAALGDDPNFAVTIASGLANKAPLVHTHVSSDVTDFSSSVSGLLPVTNILGDSNITVSQSGTIFTVAVTGSLGLTTEEVDDRISNLLIAGTGISLDYNDNANTLTINTGGLQPSGDYSLVGHTHISDDITDFNSVVSGIVSSSLSTDILAGASIGLDYSTVNDTLTIYNLQESYITSLGSVSGTVPIDYDPKNRSIQTLTLGGTATTLTKGTGWPIWVDFSTDVILKITVSSATTVTWSIVTEWYNQPPAGALTVDTHLILLRAIGNSIIEGHYIGRRTL